MFKSIIDKLSKTQSEMDDISNRIIQQNKYMEELSEELLGDKMSDELMSKIVEQEFTKVIEERIKEAFE